MKLPRIPVSSELPITAMLGVAFLSIVLFMATTEFSAARGLPFELLEKPGRWIGPEEAVFIKVAADSSVLFDCQPTRVEEILPRLEATLLRDTGRPVILYVDGSAPYQAMISVYDLLASAGVGNLSVPTQSEVQKSIELLGMNPFESRCGN